MAIFGIETKKSEALERYYNKFKSGLILKFPYFGFMQKINDKFFLIYLDIAFQNPKYLAIIITLVLFMFVGVKFSAWYLISVFMFAGVFMYSKTFAYWIIHLTLRKEGHKAKINLLSEKELINGLSKWGKEK